MYSDHDPATDAFGGATPPPRDPATGAGSDEPRPPLLPSGGRRGRLRDLFRDAVSLTLDTLDDAGDRVSRGIDRLVTEVDRIVPASRKPDEPPRS